MGSGGGGGMLERSGLSSCQISSTTGIAAAIGSASHAPSNADPISTAKRTAKDQICRVDW
jgi:hypothetical protein